MSEQDELTQVMTMLDQLGPAVGETRPTPPQALARFKSQTLSQRSVTPMSRFKPVFVTVLAIALVALVFSFPATRVLAGNFLGLFRVEKFAPISVSPEQLALLGKLADQGFYPGQLEMVQEPGPAQSFATVDQALRYLATQETSGYRAILTTRNRPNRIEVQPGGSARLTVNLAAARQLLTAAGVDPQLLPDSLDGAVIDGSVADAVLQTWGDITLLQMPTPQINYPENVDVTVVGEAFLRILGMQPDEASRLAHNIDWTSTLVLPIPATAATFSEVRIADTTGLALQSLDQSETTILWQRNDRVYLLNGLNKDVNALVRFAETLR